MNMLQQLITFIKSLFVWWFIVDPWQGAVRVRFGKNPTLFKAGVHFRIPYFDEVFIQNTRRRVSSIPIQTLTSSDRKCLTLHGSLGYSIADVMKLQSTLHNAEQSVQQEIAGLMARYVATHTAEECTPSVITDYVVANQKLERYGLGDVDFFLTGYVSDLPTFRLIQDSMQSYDYDRTKLSTVAAAQPGVYTA
jgi:hypothetical protein